MWRTTRRQSSFNMFNCNVRHSTQLRLSRTHACFQRTVSNRKGIVLSAEYVLRHRTLFSVSLGLSTCKPRHWRCFQFLLVCQHTRDLIMAWNTWHKYKQQRPESPTNSHMACVVNKRGINSTRGTSLHQRYILKEDVHGGYIHQRYILKEDVHGGYTSGRGYVPCRHICQMRVYRRRPRSLLLYLCYIFRALINSLMCWLCTSALSLVQFQIFSLSWSVSKQTNVKILMLFWPSTFVLFPYFHCCRCKHWLIYEYHEQYPITQNLKYFLHL